MKSKFFVSIATLCLLSCGDSVTYTASHRVASKEAQSSDAKVRKPIDDSTSCSSNNEVVFEKRLFFTNENAPGCFWGEKDNLIERNGFFQAYVMKDIDVSMPDASKICQISLDMEPTSMKFDDESFLLIDEAIILSSHNYNSLFKTDDRDLRIFDWEKIKGRSYKRSSDANLSFCLGENIGVSECIMPLTEETEEMSFSIDPQVLSGLELLKDGEKSTISWVVTGDNDASDCMYKNFYVKLRVSYLE